MKNLRDLFNTFEESNLINEDIFTSEIGAEGFVGTELGGNCFIEEVESTTAYVNYNGGKYWMMELNNKNYENFIDLYPKIKKFVFRNDVIAQLHGTDFKNIPLCFEQKFHIYGDDIISNLNLEGIGSKNVLTITCGEKGDFKKVKAKCDKARLNFDGSIGLIGYRSLPDNIEITCKDLYIIFKAKGISNFAYEHAVNHYNNDKILSEKDIYNRFLKEIKEDVFKEINLDPKKIKFKEIHFDADSYPNDRYKLFKQNFTWNEIKKA